MGGKLVGVEWADATRRALYRPHPPKPSSTTYRPGDFG